MLSCEANIICLWYAPNGRRSHVVEATGIEPVITQKRPTRYCPGNGIRTRSLSLEETCAKPLNTTPEYFVVESATPVPPRLF